MLEDLMLTFLARPSKSKECFDPDPAGVATAAAAAAAAAGLFSVVAVMAFIYTTAFSASVAYMAYRCNGSNFLAGIASFLFPRVYVVLHAVRGFRCATRG
jgi:hypothetical protein